MHPDKKVGMALGILLVGIVAAFFFRNDTEATEKEDDRKLASAEELDDRIRQGAQVPYLPDREATPAHSGDVPDINIDELIAEIPDINPAGTGASPDSTQPVVVPRPIRIGEPGPAHERVAPIPSPASDIQGVDAALGGHTDPRGNFAPSRPRPEVVKFHEVAAGETLSEIATKYLGTHRRYLELFEANRDVLDSPDAIRVGMKLKIPQKQTAGGATTSVSTPPGAGTRELPSKPPVATAPESVEPTTPAKPSFVRPTGTVPRISSNPGRSLGQRPPPGVPRVEGLDTVIARRRQPEKAALREKPGDKAAGNR